MYKNFPSLTDAFLNYFDVALAVSPDQLELVERLRYKVYCQEFDYEPAENFPDYRERDRYDDHALHCLITHKRSRRPAACVRLICASETETLPIEDNCAHALHLEYHEVLCDDRSDLCEFSRLAVDRYFRKRRGEDHTCLGEYDAVDCCHQEQRSFSLVSTATFLAAFALADLAGRQRIFAMMEPNLPRLLRRAGLLFQQAGDAMEYHGSRTPYFITTKFALENMREDLHTLYDAIFQQMEYGASKPRSVSFA